MGKFDQRNVRRVRPSYECIRFWSNFCKKASNNLLFAAQIIQHVNLASNHWAKVKILKNKKKSIQNQFLNSICFSVTATTRQGSKIIRTFQAPLTSKIFKFKHIILRSCSTIYIYFQTNFTKLFFICPSNELVYSLRGHLWSQRIKFCAKVAFNRWFQKWVPEVAILSTNLDFAKYKVIHVDICLFRVDGRSSLGGMHSTSHFCGWKYEFTIFKIVTDPEGLWVSFILI